MVLRRRLVPLMFVVLSVAVPAAPAHDSYAQSRPLSAWVADLGAQPPQTRVAAADAIAQLAILHGGSTVAAAVQPLVRNLADASPAVRESAAAAIEQIGQPALPAVDALLTLLDRDADRSVRRHAALALARVDPASKAASRSLEQDSAPGVRQAAAIILVASRRAAAPAQHSLADAIADDDAGVRLYAAAALVGVEGPQRGVPVLLESLEHPDPTWRAEAAGILGEVAVSETDVLPALARALEDEDPSVRVAVADAFGQVGRPARSFVSALGARLRDPDEIVRERVAAALQRIRE
jgi:HEAT repeat protein